MESQHEVIEDILDRLGCFPKWRGRYWLIRCPRHEDRSPSAQCFPDGWLQCHAGCGRFHINSIVGKEVISRDVEASYEKAKEEEIKRGDFTNLWADLDPLDDTLDIKGISGRQLNKLGWRWYPGGNGYMKGVFIPYFNMDRSAVPFFQIRHLEGERRFTFAKGITPIIWGYDVLSKVKKDLVLTEGSRDAAILRTVGVPAVAAPSASSGALVKKLSEWCRSRDILLTVAYDNDTPGKKLVEAIETPFKALPSPEGKDVGDLLLKRGWGAVVSFYGHLKVSEEAV